MQAGGSCTSCCPACASKRGLGVSFGKDAAGEDAAPPTHWFCRDCHLLSRRDDSEDEAESSPFQK